MKNIIIFIIAMISAACNQNEVKTVTSFKCPDNLIKYTLQIENEKSNKIENYDIYLTDINDHSGVPCGKWIYEEKSLDVISAGIGLCLTLPYTDHSWQLEKTDETENKIAGVFYQETWGALIPSGRFIISK